MCTFCVAKLNLRDSCAFEDTSSSEGSGSGSILPANGQIFSESPGLDAAGSTGTAYSMAAGDTFNGTISTTNDVDWVKVTIQPGDVVNFTVQQGGSSPLGANNYYVRLYDSNGNLLVSEQSYTETSSTLSYANTTGSAIDVFVSASDFGSNNTGTYQIVTEVNAPLTEFTLQEIADQLKTGYWGGGPYAWNVGPGDSISVNITALTAAGQNLALEAMEAWTMVTGIQFTVTTGAAQMTFDDNQSGAFASFSTSGGYITSANVNVSTNWLSTYGTSLDSYSFQTYIHEIGHALGLGHAGNYNGSASFPADAHYSNDSWQATVMSYFSQTTNSFIDASYAFVITPMMADILAVQQLYGVAGNLRTGDTTYGNNSNAGGYYDDIETLTNAVTFTIIDDGGNDTLDTSGATQNQNVDLNDGEISDLFGLTGNLSIYTGTIIENFIGGSAVDNVIGNEANNRLNGAAGADILSGAAGLDRLWGNSGSDTLTGGSDADIFFFAESASAQNVTDTITDFNSGEGDVLLLVNHADDASDFSVASSGNNVTLSLLGASGNQQISFTGLLASGGLSSGFLEIIDLNGAASAQSIFVGLTPGFAAGDAISQVLASGYQQFLLDVAGTSPLASEVNDFHHDGTQKTNVKTFDNGSWRNTFFDWDDNDPYVQRTDVYSSTGTLDEVITQLDDTTSTWKYFDNDASDSWQEYTYIYDTGGATSQIIILYDNDTGFRRYTDTLSVQSWTTFNYYYDTAGNTTQTIVNQDNGDTVQTYFDVASVQAWEAYLYQYNSGGDHYFSQITWDDDSYRHIFYDYDDSQAWDQYILDYDAAGNLINDFYV